jgi:GT2 family glycosyltransferase
MQKIKKEITTVVTRFNEPFEVVKHCVDSLSKQKSCQVTILFLDQVKSKETKLYIQNLRSKNVEFKYINVLAKSLSFARNTGLRMAKTDLVAFCDVDCILEENWSNEIVKTFKKYHATIVGTKILPIWEHEPSWYHNSKIIQEFYSLLNLSNSYSEIPKVIGASFAVDKSKIAKDLVFNEKLGRRKGALLGGEETEFCSNVLKSGGKIFYTPFTYANHTISSQRMKLSWLYKRAYFGGLSRALKGGRSEPFNKKVKLFDRLAMIFILVPYMLGYTRGRTLK